VWFPGSSFELITHVDEENHSLAWSALLAPRFIFHAVRWQALTAVEGGKTKYETIEVFGGPLAWVVKFLFEGGLNKGFQAMAEGLKNRSEELRDT
jgi:hypothetical protein